MSWAAHVRVGVALATTALAALACGGGDTARVTIPAGATMRAAAESLSRGGVVRWPALSSAYARVRGRDRGIKAGTYLLVTGASWNAILSALRGGGSVITVLVPEGFTVTQIDSVLRARLSVSADSVAAAVRDTAVLRRLDVPTATLEGYLFPDTYFFPPGTSARSAIATMVRRFEQQWRPEWRGRLDSVAMTRHDIVTLASIVEREARRDEERPLIAAVYVGRLKRGMLLQADPTVQYALPQYQRRLLLRHLTVDSPYNTYRHRGLPPGPIAAPGVASIRAALYPANVPFLYFVAFPDGHHEFRMNVEQHLAAVRAARRAWDTLERSRRTPAAAASPSPARP